jgi:hypothetical protein
MTTTQIVTLIVVTVVVLAVLVVASVMARRAALRRRFGPEYDRAVAEHDGRIAAERDLRERQRRHAQLELRPLDDAAREKFAAEWRAVQAKFLVDPAAAVLAGDDLVTRLATARGYPTKGYEDQLSYLSVEHARTLGHYRDAHEICQRAQKGSATTEELRRALVHYRELVADLLGEAPQTIVDGEQATVPSRNGDRHA